LDLLKRQNHSVVVQEAPILNTGTIELTPGTRFSHISPTMFLKAEAIELLVAAYDYVLYLDSDTLAFGDLQCEQIVGFSEAAAVCLDLSSASGLDDPHFFENCDRNGVPKTFFNSGVMIINSKMWAQTHASARFLENLAAHEGHCPYFDKCAPNDQCALNMTLGSDVKLLPTAWNVQKSALHMRIWENALIRHYTGPAKFLPIRARTCDLQEYSLLKAISLETKIPLLSNLYDYGISYQLNKIRRREEIRKHLIAMQNVLIEP
jgi:lipopolysaccharide biosynthesis glycosyltransferase